MQICPELATEQLNSLEKRTMPANGLSPDLGTAQIREIWSLQLSPELRLAARGLSALHIICNTLIVADEFFPRPASFRCWAAFVAGLRVGWAWLWELMQRLIGSGSSNMALMILKVVIIYEWL